MKTIIGYHGTELAQAKSIVEDGFTQPCLKLADDPVDEEEWMGPGIYFFGDHDSYKDGFDNAIVWAEKAKRYEKVGVVKARIQSDSFIDIREREYRLLFTELARDLYKSFVDEGRDTSLFSDTVVFARIAEEVDPDFIITEVNTRPNIDYMSFAVIWSQIWILVRKASCIDHIEMLKPIKRG